MSNIVERNVWVYKRPGINWIPPHHYTQAVVSLGNFKLCSTTGDEWTTLCALATHMQ